MGQQDRLVTVDSLADHVEPKRVQPLSDEHSDRLRVVDQDHGRRRTAASLAHMPTVTRFITDMLALTPLGW
jgi:hypothetical protein